jgi:hypothetical protein
VVDAIREYRPPFSPEAVVAECADTLKSYNALTVLGDKSALGWVSEQFARYGITYLAKAPPKSELYGTLLATINSKRVDLLDHKRLVSQLIGLERRTSRGGDRDSIDHAPSQHDDVSNAVAGIVAQLIGKSRYDVFALADQAPNDPKGMEAWRRLRRNLAYESGFTLDIAQHNNGRMIDWR